MNQAVCLDCMAPTLSVTELKKRAEQLEDTWTKLPIDVLTFKCPTHGDRHWWWFEDGQRLARMNERAEGDRAKR